MLEKETTLNKVSHNIGLRKPEQQDHATTWILNKKTHLIAFFPFILYGIVALVINSIWRAYELLIVYYWVKSILHNLFCFIVFLCCTFKVFILTAIIVVRIGYRFSKSVHLLFAFILTLFFLPIFWILYWCHSLTQPGNCGFLFRCIFPKP